MSHVFIPVCKCKCLHVKLVPLGECVPANLMEKLMVVVAKGNLVFRIASTCTYALNMMPGGRTFAFTSNQGAWQARNKCMVFSVDTWSFLPRLGLNIRAG